MPERSKRASTEERGKSMEIRYYWSVLLKWGWLVVLSTALAAGLSYRANTRAPKLYQASTSILVGRSLQAQNPNPNDFAADQALAKDYTQVATGQAILQATITSLGLTESWEVLSQHVNASNMQGSDTFTIQVVDQDPRRAKRIADEIARQIILASPTPKEGDPQRQFANQQMNQLAGQIKDAQAQIADLQKRADNETSAVTLQDLRNQISFLQQKVSAWQNTYGQISNFYQGGTTNYLTVVQPAIVPTTPVGTNTVYNTVVAGGIGLLLALGGIVLAEILDDTLKSPADVTRTLGLPILGGTARARRVQKPSDLLFPLNAPQSIAAEASRFLGTNVAQALHGDGSSVVLVTSPGPLDGKSTVAANLAVSIAETGRKVVLVDANLHRPSIHRFFDLANREGLSTLLRDDALPLTAVLQSTTIPTLQVLTSGPLVPTPGSLLSSPILATRLAEIRARADVVILDSAAVLGVAETLVLGTLSDAILLVARTGRTRRDAAVAAISAIERVGLRVRGIVLDGQNVGRASYQRYYAVSPKDAQGVTSEQCPHLGLRGDRSSVALGLSADHRCFAARTPIKIGAEHQANYCLGGAYQGCPRFAAAPDRSARNEPPIVLETQGARDIR